MVREPASAAAAGAIGDSYIVRRNSGYLCSMSLLPRLPGIAAKWTKLSATISPIAARMVSIHAGESRPGTLA